MSGMTQCEIDIAGTIFHHDLEYTRNDLCDLFPHHPVHEIDTALKTLRDVQLVELVKHNGRNVYKTHRKFDNAKKSF